MLYLHYYRSVQFIGLISIVLNYLRILRLLMIFKSFGFYVMVIHKIIKSLVYFLIYFITMMVIISRCYWFLFSSIDINYETELNSFYQIFSVPLGGYGY